MNTAKPAAPVELKVAASLYVGIALVVVAVAMVLVFGGGGTPRTLLLPITSLVLGGLVAAGLALRMPSSRWAGYAVSVLFAVLYVFVMLSAELWWIRVIYGVAAAGYVYAAILLSSAPLLRYVTGSR